MQNAEVVDPSFEVEIDGRTIAVEFTFGALMRAQKALQVENTQTILNRCTELDAHAICALVHAAICHKYPDVTVDQVGDALPLKRMRDIAKALGNSFGSPGEEEEARAVAEKN